MASMIPTSHAVLDEEPSAAVPDDGSMTFCKEYTAWKTFTLDVHRYAAAQGKQVITDPRYRGGKSRHMRCTDYQEKLLGYENAVLAK